MIKVVLVQYNKPTNQSFENMLQHCPPEVEARIVQLTDKPKYIDLLNYKNVEKALQPHEPFDAIVMGDIFWPTGQSLCNYCKRNGKTSHFLQHGQWIYVANKMNPRHCPAVTHLYGTAIQNAVLRWPYAAKSKVLLTGSPRYDNLNPQYPGEGIYFAPPVIKEVSSGRNFPTISRTAMTELAKLKGLDSKFKLHIQPHYREGDLNTIRSLFPKADLIPASDDPFPWIAKCAKVLTHRNSTTVLDAIAHRKKTVLMNFEGESLESAYPRQHFGIFAVESKSPQNCFNHLSSPAPDWPDNYEELAKRHIYLGNASERVFQSIMEYA